MATPVNFERYLPNTFVQIDGKGKAKVLKVTERRDGPMYTVQLDGIDFQADLPAHRVTSFIDNVENVPGTGNDSRFVHMNESEIDDFVTVQANKNTLSKTFYDNKLLRKFMDTPEINESRQIHEIPPQELCTLLCKFFVGVRKSDGSQYEPTSLRGFLGSFDRQLKRFRYGYSLHTSIEFAQLQDVLKSKQKELKRSGLGNAPKKAEPVTEGDIERFWKARQFGIHTPDSIINTLWFYNTIHFGLRGSDEHRDMCWGDINLCTDSNGQEYLDFTERQTKTRTGANPRDVRCVKPKMWSNIENPERCPVTVYKQYALLRPTDFCKSEDPFYIATNTKKYLEPGDKSFKKQPIGVNKLTSLMSRMATAAGLSVEKKLSNHSARKHLVQKLTEHNVPPTHIMQITGHKNVQSVNNYSHINEQQHRQISSILSNQSMCVNQNTLATYPPQVQSMSVHQHALASYPPQVQLSSPLTQCNTAVSNQLQNNSSSTRNNSQTVQDLSVSDCISSMFSGNIFGGTFNINVAPSAVSEIPTKRRRINADSDSD